MFLFLILDFYFFLHFCFVLWILVYCRGQPGILCHRNMFLYIYLVFCDFLNSYVNSSSRIVDILVFWDFLHQKLYCLNGEFNSSFPTCLFFPPCLIVLGSNASALFLVLGVKHSLFHC